MTHRPHRPTAVRLAGGLALTLALATALPATAATAAPQHGTVPKRSAAPAIATSTTARPSLPRNCLAEYTTVGGRGIVTSLVWADRSFTAFPYEGWRITPAPRFVEPVGFDESDATASMTSIVARADGVLESVRVTAQAGGADVGSAAPEGLGWASPPAAKDGWVVAKPVRIGHGWQNVRDVAAPGDATAPYLFALLGDRLNRYTYGPDAKRNAVVRNGPHAATAGFRGVRSITWTRQTTVRGVPADVLVGLDGARLVEYTVPRVAKPRVTSRVLGAHGWGAIQRVDAGMCFTSLTSTTPKPTRSIPILGTMGRSVRLYVDRNGHDGSGRDITGYGQVGLRP